MFDVDSLFYLFHVLFKLKTNYHTIKIVAQLTGHPVWKFSNFEAMVTVWFWLS